jgi:bifunctional DNA-binding transcriptional regulator/antitoxin component of YhaV-PrlF toxin-antitoxin module
MTKLQRTSKDQYFLIIPRDLIRLVGWKEGDEIDIRSGSEVSPGKKDLVLRKVS